MTTLKESIMVDLDRVTIKLKALIEVETSPLKRATLKEMLQDMKINKMLL